MNVDARTGKNGGYTGTSLALNQSNSYIPTPITQADTDTYTRPTLTPTPIPMPNTQPNLHAHAQAPHSCKLNMRVN